MSAHPVSEAEGGLNQTEFEVTDSLYKAFTVSTNQNGVNILCFEEFEFKNPINLEEFPVGSFVRCGGILQKIEFNPNKSKIWILRLTVSDAFARNPNLPIGQ
ncbi:MAG: hypothetical protein C4K58_08000 [Flavobacteriaceae bacterium]|nr:MAG: hypothetical protein C4K58_08000 [Flavobacteriaceae bacterium]